MKTVSKINPEKEYENAKKIIEQASTRDKLDNESLQSLDLSVDNIMTAARVLMEREERRRSRNKPPKNTAPKNKKDPKPREDYRKLPSDRYPDLEVEENELTPEVVPTCPCCNETMRKSGLFDTTEKIEFEPARYWIQRIKRPKYNCSHCHGSMINTPAEPSISAKSGYSDNFIINVTLDKYCDLIPITRQAAIMERAGMIGVPAQSLINLTHHLAQYLLCIYDLLREQALRSFILYMDETPHKMLEEGDGKSWYLWGYFTEYSCYYEAHNSRSGDIPKNFLLASNAKYLMCDDMAGYGRAVREILKEKKREIIELQCNAHAVRYFREASETWESELEVVRQTYKKIYELEDQKKETSNLQVQLNLRQQMKPLFEKIKNECEEMKPMPHSSLHSSSRYFLNNYQGLTFCCDYIDIPLDNNLSERNLRAPVVGRKTWYGNHSKRGAKTTCILFSIVQSCKLVNVNPRSYFPWIIKRLHSGLPPLTPYDYGQLKEETR